MHRFLLAIFLLGASNLPAAAQLDEIVVTASKRESVDIPGVVLSKRADNLLLEISIINDTREKDLREKELFETMENLLKAADADKAISLSLDITDDAFVRPLTRGNYQSRLRHDVRRKDTSQFNVQVKTAIPVDEKDPYALIQKLENFADGVELVGRTEIITTDSVSVSLIDPKQYRKEILKLVANDISQMTASLGLDYRAIIDGISGPVYYVRSGVLEVDLYIPYEYVIIPKSMTSFHVEAYD